MATIKKFKKLADVEGVANYVLVRRDGQVVSENMVDAVSLASTIVMSGVNCEAMEGYLKEKRYKYLSIERENGKNLIIFSLGNFFLGIIKQPGYQNKTIVDAIFAFLKSLTSKGTNHAVT